MWVSIFSTTETFLILTGTEPDIIIPVYGPSCNVPVILIKRKSDMNFLGIFSKNNRYFVKIHPVGAELFYLDEDRQTDRQTDRYDGANSRFSQFCERA